MVTTGDDEMTEQNPEYLRLVFQGQNVFTEWCIKPTSEKCPDVYCHKHCKFKVRKDT
jgi:hypothetical protein